MVPRAREGLAFRVFLVASLAACSPPKGTGPAPRPAPSVPDAVCDTGLRAEYVLGEAWPPDVRLDVIYGRVRRGFSVEQVQAAKSTRDNRGGSAAMTHEDVLAPDGRRGRALVYPDETFVLVDGRVVDIQPTKVLELR